MTRIIITKCLFLEQDFDEYTGKDLDEDTLTYLCLQDGDILSKDIEKY